VSKFVYPIYSMIVYGDTAKYGPGGTNEYAFQIHQEIPDQFLGGDLAESWEVNATGLTFHLRKGVMYTGNSKIGMAKREVTAADIVAGMNHILEGPLGQGIKNFVKSVSAPDKYTVKVDFNYYEFTWGAMLIYGMGCVYYPPEVIAAGASDWRNQSGSGAFILENYVSGAGATYKKNPDYYLGTTIGGKAYKTPFVDKLVIPTITDELTMIGALRTGKIDICQVPVTYVDTLADTNPELVLSEYVDGGMMTVAPQCLRPPFSDPNVRRALMVGIDHQAYVDTVLKGKGVINPFPTSGSPYWTPIDKMPAETAVLFSNNKVLAKKMLADAGYPNGLKTKMYFKPSVARDADCAAFLQSEWAKIGVDVEMIGMEQTVHEALRFSREFDGLYVRSDANGGTTELPQRKTECGSMAASWNDKWFDEQVTKAQQMVDAVERSKILKEAALYFVNSVGNLNMPAGMQFKYWWPWVNNYHGEEELGYGNQQPALNMTWIDSAKKKQMGF
jgi:peptide/nickel transport system substrate-binding protein